MKRYRFFLPKEPSHHNQAWSLTKTWLKWWLLTFVLLYSLHINPIKIILLKICPNYKTIFVFFFWLFRSLQPTLKSPAIVLYASVSKMNMIVHLVSVCHLHVLLYHNQLVLQKNQNQLLHLSINYHTVLPKSKYSIAYVILKPF